MFVGRPDSNKPAPNNMLPSSTFSASQSMDLFAKKGVSPAGLVALLGAHTCSQSHGQSPAVPQDTSPGNWDTDYFSETLRNSASPGVGRFMSDVLLAKDSDTRPVFEDFANNLGSWDQVCFRGPLLI
jgi:catalase (peroxidase I)